MQFDVNTEKWAQKAKRNYDWSPKILKLEKYLLTDFENISVLSRKDDTLYMDTNPEDLVVVYSQIVQFFHLGRMSTILSPKS